MSNINIEFNVDGNNTSPVVNTDSIFTTGGVDLQTYIVNLVYPIGSYYWSSEATDPATLFGGGAVWTQIKDKFILAAGDTYTAGTVGGSATHNHTQASNTGSTILTTNQIPAHTHGSKSLTSGSVWLYGAPGFQGVTSGVLKAGGGTTVTTASLTTTSGITAYKSITVDATHEHTSVGGGQGHTHTLSSTGSSSNIPPHEVAYCWKRTA